MKLTLHILLFFFSSFCFGQTKVKPYKQLNDSVFNKNDIILINNLLFATGSCELLPGYRDSVKVISDFIKQHPNLIIEIGVHTDNRGEKKLLLNLSQCRSETIESVLTKDFQVSGRNIAVKGYGSSQLMYNDASIRKVNKKTVKGQNEAESLHLKNRRIELKIIKILKS